MKLYFFVLLVFWSYTSTSAQVEALNFNFQKITLEQGLSGNSYNYFLFQDSRGFIWVSSMNGLSRFDGNQVRHFGLREGMKDENIQSQFFEDKNGNIWFSTYTGLNCYKTDLDSIINVPLYTPLGVEIEKDLKLFYFDKNKNELWAKGGNHIFKVSTNENYKSELLNFNTNGFDFNVILSKNSNEIQCILASPWYGKGIEKIIIEDGEMCSKIEYLPNLEGVKKAISTGVKEWILLSKDRLYYFNENQVDTFQVLKNEQEFEFWDLLKFSNQYLLVTTKKNGIWLYNLHSEKFEKQWKNEENNSGSLSSDNPRNLYIQGNLLMTSCDNFGVNLSFLYSNDFDNPLGENSIYTIFFVEEDDGNNIWYSSLDGKLGVFLLDNKHINNVVAKSNRNGKLPFLQIKRGIDNLLLVHTQDSVFIVNDNFEDLSIIDISDSLLLKYQLAIYPNRTLFSTSKGIKEIDKHLNGEYYLKTCPEFNDIKGFQISNIFSVSNNKVLIPYDASELWLYQATKNGLVEIAKVPCKMMMYSLIESKKYPNLLWAGTSKGLVKITNDTIIQPIFDENSKMGTRTVYGVVEDDDGYLWLTTNKGLWQYHPETGVLNHYDEEDGLNGDIFSLYNSAMMSSQNEIWLGTNKGLIKFDPKKIKPYSIPPKVYIDQLLINDETEVKGIGVKDELVLKHDQSTLLFEVIPVLLYKADRAKVNYRLENYDGSWLSVKNGQKIRYTKIPPGKYTFKVMAEDVNGNQSEVKELAITVQPHFTQTWWFYLLATFATGLLMYAIYRYRVAQIKEDQAKKTAIAQLELQVAENELKALRAQMNPHFLFNAMNSIKGIIIQQEVNSAIEYLTKFSMLIRTILSNSEKKSILLKNELEALQLYIELEALRFTGSFKFQINVDRTVDKSYVRIPPLILQPFVENAIWHGLMPKGDTDKKLLINIFRKDDFVLCEIEDNGIGRKKSQERNRKKKHNSMGIGITEKRIKMLHPDNEVFIVDLEDAQEQGSGTKVIVKIFAPD